MKKIIIAGMLVSLFILGCADSSQVVKADQLTLTEQPTIVEVTPTISPTPIIEITPTPTSKSTPSPTITPTCTPTVMPTCTPTPTEVPKEYIENPKEKVNLILDTDLGSDIDDACAVRIASTLHRQNKINLLCVGSCLDGDYACRAIHGILSYDELYEVPLGMARRGIDIDHNYTDCLVSRFCDYQTYKMYDCVDLYKESIKSVDKARIVTTGFLVNIEDLLRDPEGYELVKDKVDSIWIVGGTYPVEDRDFNFYWTEDAITSIRYVNENSPVPIIYITNSSGCDYSTGKIIMCGWGLKRLDPDMNDPLTAAFDEFEKSYSVDSSGGNACWDGLAVYTASVSREESQTYIVRTDVSILEDGTSIFYPGENGRHTMLERYLDVNQYSEILDSLTKAYMK